LGACLGQENSLKYNLRFIQAFNPLKLKRWPFSSSIAVTETFGELQAVHFFNDWMHCATQTNYSIPKSYSIDQAKTFDLDIYKITTRYLLNPRQQFHLKPVNLDLASTHPIDLQ
jgi:hypothetical protein